MRHLSTTVLTALLLAVALTASGTAAAQPMADEPGHYRRAGDESATDRQRALLDAAPVGLLADTTVRAAETSFASESCIPDPTGDTQPGDFAKADIIAVCARHQSDSVLFELTPRAASNPVTDANWVNGVTGWIGNLDIDDDFEADGYMLFWNDTTGVFVDVFNANDEYVCTGQTGVDGATLLARIPTSCLGNPSVLNADAYLFYDSDWDDPDAPVYGDGLDGTTRTSPVQGQQEQPATTPVAEEPPSTTTRATSRLAGGDRFATAVAISQHQFPGGAGVVYLSRSDEFADSIAGASLTGGPVLLVPQCGAVPTLVLDEVRRLAPSQVIALGGTGAVCDEVLSQVAAA